MKHEKDFSDFKLDFASKPKPYSPPVKKDTETVELTSGEVSGEGSYKIPTEGQKRPTSNIRTADYNKGGASFNKKSEPEKTTVTEYEKSGLLRRVSVKSWPTSYSFYEKFVRDAVYSHSKKGTKVPHAPFFSYIPQYTHLTNASWAYYLYVKESLKNGVRLPDADFSYVLLYVYETINLEGVISPEEGVNTLATIWTLYRPLHPNLDKYMSEWMADYCLSYRLPLPEKLHKLIPEAAARSTIKEFYADYATDNTVIGRLIRMTLCDYDPSRSRCAAGIENFAEEVYAVFDAVIAESHRSQSGIFSPKLRRTVTLKRDAFCGSLCASNVKKQITLELDSFFRTPEAARMATEIMKGCENIVRARHGIKARLSAPTITGSSPLINAKTETELEYLSFYDAPSTPLSASRAAEIESASWRNAETLGADDTFEEGPDFSAEPEGALFSESEAEDLTTKEIPATEESVPAPESTTEPETFAEAIKAEPELLAGLILAAKGGDFAAWCRERQIFADSAAEKINSIASTYIGDVVLEKSGNTYVFVTDYLDELPL